MSEDEGSAEGLGEETSRREALLSSATACTEMNGEPFSRTPHVKKNKYLRGYKAQIGFHIHCTWSLRPNTCKSGLIWSMPLHEYTVLPAVFQHSEHHACSAVTRSPTRQSQIASSIGLWKSNSRYSGVTKTQTILAKIEICGRQVFTLRGFWVLDKTWWTEGTPPCHSVESGPPTAVCSQEDCLHRILPAEWKEQSALWWQVEVRDHMVGHCSTKCKPGQVPPAPTTWTATPLHSLSFLFF